MNSLQHGQAVFSLLFRRDMRILSGQIVSNSINSLVIVFLQIVMLGYFLPAQGLDTEFIFPLFLGNMFISFFSVGFQYSMQMTFDLSGAQLFAYHYSIVNARLWVLLAYFLGVFIRLAIFSTIICVVGVIFLHYTAEITIQLPYLLVIYTLSLAFFSLLFLATGIGFTPEDHMDNLWPRLFIFLLTFGSVTYTWKRINSLSPLLSKLFLLNPVTYCTEGMRGAFLGTTNYISPIACISVLLIAIGVLSLLVSIALRKRIDPV